MESKLYILEENEMKNRLEEIRKERGIRQEELARALEVSRQTIGSLENGRYNPSILLAFKDCAISAWRLRIFSFMRRNGMRGQRKGGFLLAAGVIFVAVSVFVKDSYYANILCLGGECAVVIGFCV